MKFDDKYKKLKEEFTLDKNDARAKKDFNKGDIIGIIKYDDKVTELGKGLKKSSSSNVNVVKTGGKLFAIANKVIDKGDNLSAPADKLSFRKDGDDEDGKKTVRMVIKRKK